MSLEQRTKCKSVVNGEDELGEGSRLLSCPQTAKASSSPADPCRVCRRPHRPYAVDMNDIFHIVARRSTMSA